MIKFSRLKNLDSNAVKNAFFANYLGALIMLKLHDLKGLSLVKDKSHSKLSKFDTSMSDLNFWGRALFHPHDPLVKRSLLFGHADILADESGRILLSRIDKIMQVVYQNPQAINWEEVVNCLIIMKHRYTIKSSYYSNIAVAIKNWNSSTENVKRKAVSDTFSYLSQSDPQSNLVTHFRELSGMTMLNDLKTLAMKVISIKRLGESRITMNEDGEAVSVANIATPSFAMFGGTNNIIKPAALDNPIDTSGYTKNTAVTRVKKRKKLFKVTRFKAPDSYKKLMKRNKE